MGSTTSMGCSTECPENTCTKVDDPVHAMIDEDSESSNYDAIMPSIVDHTCGTNCVSILLDEDTQLGAKEDATELLSKCSENAAGLPFDARTLSREPLTKQTLKSKAAPSPVCTSDGSESTSVILSEGVESLSCELIQGLLKDGLCLLIDSRGGDRAAGLIEGALHVPAISATEPFAFKLPELVVQHKHTRLIVFFCQFCKHRAPFCANLFREETNKQGNTMQRVAIMEGGFREWHKTGLPCKNEGLAAEQAFADAFARHQGIMVMRRAA